MLGAQGDAHVGCQGVAVGRSCAPAGSRYRNGQAICASGLVIWDDVRRWLGLQPRVW